MKRKILFFFSLIMALAVPSVAFAEEYGSTYPDYVPVSGGAYIEVQSTLGRGALVFSSEYKDGYFGFYGTGYSVANITKNTVNGTYYSSSGTAYNVRLSAMGEAQYYREVTTTRYEWTKLSISKIYNTNCKFQDLKDDRGNVIDLFNYDPLVYMWFAFMILISILLLYLCWRCSCA